MSFLSPGYFLFFPLAALGYFALPGWVRNGWLLLCSWFFYLCAGPEYFLFLLSTVAVTFFAARSLEKKARKGLLAGTLCLFVGALFLFKYLNFAADTLSRLLGAVGLDWSPVVPKLLLPAGISFYLFAAMGYLIDVYRGKLPAEQNFVKCALFFSFFPALLSGPIGRGEALLPQFDSLHKFSYVNLREGFFRFLWGAFKKLVLADRLAVVVDTVFAAPERFGAVQVLLAACAFSIQIYCDFSAYSDMAVGSARVMGFQLMENFRTPYFSQSIAEFWRRWHISLSTWFRDYLYIPLGGSRRGTVRKYVNVLIVFAVSGLWHGSALSFLVWGLLNGVYQVAGGITAPARKALWGRWYDSKLARLWRVGWVFLLATAAWVFFEAGSVTAALAVLGNMVKPVLWDAGGLPAMGMGRKEFLVAGVGFLVLLGVDWYSGKADPAREVARASRWVRWGVYLALLLSAVIFGSYGTGYDAQSFIYGQF